MTFFISSTNKEFQSLKLSDLQVLATLGVGGFGRVELVQVNNDSTRSFALKQMKKSQVSTVILYSLYYNVLNSSIYNLII